MNVKQPHDRNTMDDVLKRMLSTPPEPHKPKAAKPKAKKKKPA